MAVIAAAYMNSAFVRESQPTLVGFVLLAPDLSPVHGWHDAPSRPRRANKEPINDNDVNQRDRLGARSDAGQGTRGPRAQSPPDRRHEGALSRLCQARRRNLYR